MTLTDLEAKLKAFAEARDWAQFHSPKNLAMALAGEVGELNALLQWVESDDMGDWLAERDNYDKLRFEIADVLNYLLLFAGAVGVDAVAAGLEKVEVNEERYPQHLSRGTASKYTELR